MSGHSKWSQIKRDKAANDGKRAAKFAQWAKKITFSVREGGSGDPSLNFRLRVNIEQAKAAGLPNDNIARAIKNGLGESNGKTWQGVQYEGYGPGGSAIVIIGATDNRNRCVQEVKNTLHKFGGSLGGIGSVAWQFQDYEITIWPKDKSGQIELDLIDAEAEEIIPDEDEVSAIFTAENWLRAHKQLTELGYNPKSVETKKLSKQTATLDAETKQKLDELVEALENLNDIIEIHTNAE